MELPLLHSLAFPRLCTVCRPATEEVQPVVQASIDLVGGLEYK